MSGEPALMARIYRRLVGLYPEPFRERLQESMEQTFIDLYDARPGAISIVRTFVGTLLSIADEHLLEARRNIFMKSATKKIVIAVMIGFALTLPFVILEYVNTRGFATLGFPGVLFAFLWFLSFAFVLTLTPTIRDVRSGESVVARPASFILRAVMMIAIAALWVALVRDQMPCFMGIPNCD